MLFRNTFMSNILAAIAFALEIVDFPSEVAPGRSYTITYTPADDTPTTFILREGENANLGTITTLTGTRFLLASGTYRPSAVLI
jgi:hypothetical protein